VAWKRQAGIHRPISARRRPEAGLTVLDSRSHPNPARVERILAGHTLAETRHMGSAMKFAVLAEGLADVIPRPGTTMEWDSAAGQAVVEWLVGAVLAGALGLLLGLAVIPLVNRVIMPLVKRAS
jgi:3'(2'), 5'-bisphosphate nucleotidase